MRSRAKLPKRIRIKGEGKDLSNVIVGSLPTLTGLQGGEPKSLEVIGKKEDSFSSRKKSGAKGPTPQNWRKSSEVRQISQSTKASRKSKEKS